MTMILFISKRKPHTKLPKYFRDSAMKTCSRGQNEMWLAVGRTSVFSVIKTVNVMETFLWILRSIKKYISDIIKPKASISYSQTWPCCFLFFFHSFFFLFCSLDSVFQPRKLTNSITRITPISIQMLLYK